MSESKEKEEEEENANHKYLRFPFKYTNDGVRTPSHTDDYIELTIIGDAFFSEELNTSPFTLISEKIIRIPFYISDARLEIYILKLEDLKININSPNIINLRLYEGLIEVNNI